ncbi:MAG: MarR family winged helix-turn-helix transcriptional regulator [Ruminococcus sp.]
MNSFMSESDGIVNALKFFSIFHRIIFDNINLREHNLSKSQIYILLSLVYGKKLTVSNIARMTSTSKEQTSRAITALVKEGYAEKAFDINNRRIVLISMTKKGYDLLTQGRESVNQRITEKFNLLTDDEKSDFFKSMRCVFETFKKISEIDAEC